MSTFRITSSIYIFIILILLVILSQHILLEPIIGQGLTNEDYVGFFKVRLYGEKFFTDPINIWQKIGLHDASHDFYMAFLDLLFGENYTMYLYTSIFFKIVATLLLYPLILIITKNKLLAFLTTLLYGISYPSAGALYLYVVGNEYLGVAFMNLFLITYYLSIKKDNLSLIILSSLVLTLSQLSSSVRIFPLFVLILLIELFILIKKRFFHPSSSLFRIIIIFLPIIIITLSSLGTHGGDAYNLIGLPDFLKLVTNGNWFLTLNPLWGLGYLFLPVAYFNIFGTISTANIYSYLISLFPTSFVIFVFVLLFISFMVSRKPSRFFLISISINLILGIIMFILYTHHFRIPPNLIQEYAGPSFNAGFYSGTLAILVISISLACGIEWLIAGRKNQLLFLIFISPFFSLLFIIGQWLFTRQYYLYQEGIHRYFVIPAMGVSLFIATLLTVVYQKIKVDTHPVSILIIIICLLQVFTISKGEIAQLFNGKKGSGRDFKIQKSLQDQTFSYIPKDRVKNDLIVYIKFKSATVGDANRWEDTFDWRNLTFWLPIKRSYLTNGIIDGCIAMTWDEKELQKMVEVRNGSKGFLYKKGGNKEERCFHNGEGYSMDEKFINLEDFYAFAIEEDLKVINITEDVYKSLRGGEL